MTSSQPLIAFFQGMVFSMCALMMRMKWCAWIALYCSCISFANTKLNDDTKQVGKTCWIVKNDT